MRPLLAATCAAALLLAACGDDGEPAATIPDAPDEPVEPPAPALPDEPEPTPQLVEPRPGMEDVRAQAFESAELLDDGQTLAVRYWAGIEPCDVLDSVDVEETATEVTLTLRVGRDPEARDVACILVAQLYETRVSLESPLGDRTVIDGARGTAAGADAVA